MSTDPSDIVPDGFDADELQKRVRAKSTSETTKHCPECGRASLRHVTESPHTDPREHDYSCTIPDCLAKLEASEVEEQ